MAPSPTQSNHFTVFRKWDKPVQDFFFFCLLFTFLLNGIVMAKHTAGPKKEFSQIQQTKWLDMELPKEKCIFPSAKWNEFFSKYPSAQIKTKNKQQKKPQKKPVMWAVTVAHFQEDQTKYQPSQTHMCIYIYILIYIKKSSTPTSQQLDEESAVHTAVCQFGEITRWKTWKNLCAGKNSFICIKSALKKNPCD